MNVLRDVQPHFWDTRGPECLGSNTPHKLDLVLYFKLSLADFHQYAGLACMHWVRDGKTKSKGGSCRQDRTPLLQQQQQCVAVPGAFGRPECELQPVAPAVVCLAAAAVPAYQPEMPTPPATHSVQTAIGDQQG